MFILIQLRLKRIFVSEVIYINVSLLFGLKIPVLLLETTIPDKGKSMSIFAVLYVPLQLFAYPLVILCFALKFWPKFSFLNKFYFFGNCNLKYGLRGTKPKGIFKAFELELI